MEQKCPIIHVPTALERCSKNERAELVWIELNALNGRRNKSFSYFTWFIAISTFFLSLLSGDNFFQAYHTVLPCFPKSGYQCNFSEQSNRCHALCNIIFWRLNSRTILISLPWDMLLALSQVPYRLDILRIEARVCASPLVTLHNVCSLGSSMLGILDWCEGSSVWVDLG